MITSQHYFFNSYLSGQNCSLFKAIRTGAGFFFSDNDYLKHPDIEVKRETPCSETMSSGTVKESSFVEPSSSSPSVMLHAAAPTRKRLHRSAAATVKSYAYALSDSDDASPSHGTTSDSYQPTRTVESNLQMWIRHLSALQKDETKKVFISVMIRKHRHLLPSLSSTRRNGTSNILIFPVPSPVPSGYVISLHVSSHVERTPVSE